MGLEPLIDAPRGGRRVRLVRALVVSAVVVAFGAGLTAAAVRDEPSSLGLATVGDPAPAPAPPTDLDASTTTTGVTEPPMTTATTPTTAPATVPVVKVPLPTVTLPTLARPRPTTTTTTTGSAPAGDRCGTPSGYGDLGATRSVTKGSLTVTLEVYACEHYAGEFTQNFVHVAAADALLRTVHLDFGDGTATDVGVYRWGCADPQRPNPYHANGPFHTYTSPGAYTVTATVTTASCSPTDGSLDEQTTTVSLTIYQIAGPRPAP